LGIKKATIFSMIAFLIFIWRKIYFAGKNLPIKIRAFLTNFKSGIRESFIGNSGDDSTLVKFGTFDFVVLSTFDILTTKKQMMLKANNKDFTMSFDFLEFISDNFPQIYIIMTKVQDLS
jgi:hypothetical protein